MSLQLDHSPSSSSSSTPLRQLGLDPGVNTRLQLRLRRGEEHIEQNVRVSYNETAAAVDSNSEALQYLYISIVWQSRQAWCDGSLYSISLYCISQAQD